MLTVIYSLHCGWKLGTIWSSVAQCYYIAQAAVIKFFSWLSSCSVNKFVTIILPLFIRVFIFLSNYDLKDFVLFTSLIFHLCHVLCGGGKCLWVQWCWLPGCNIVFSYCREYITGNSWNIPQLLYFCDGNYISVTVIPSIIDSQNKLLPLTDVFKLSLVIQVGNAYWALVVIDL